MAAFGHEDLWIDGQGTRRGRAVALAVQLDREGDGLVLRDAGVGERDVILAVVVIRFAPEEDAHLLFVRAIALVGHGHAAADGLHPVRTIWVLAMVIRLAAQHRAAAVD